MMPQGTAEFNYENDVAKNNQTALAGLPLFIDILAKMNFSAIVEKHLQLRTKPNCWSDVDQILSLMFLNIAGGDCVDDIEILNSDRGFSRLIKQLKIKEKDLSRWKRRFLAKQFDELNERTFPSQTSIREYLKVFHDESQELLRRESTVKSFIPKPNKALQALPKINREIIKFVQSNSPSSIATIDLDATLIPTNKSAAKYGYKGFKAYQGFNAWWQEQQLVLNTQFRDGNVNAAYEITNFLKDTLHHLPRDVEQVSIRSDTAGYQHDLMNFCELVEKRNDEDKYFGKINFAIGVSISNSFKQAVEKVSDDEWKQLRVINISNKQPVVVECAEVTFVSKEGSRSKKSPDYRYLVTRQRLSEQMVLNFSNDTLGEQLKLPFPVTTMNNCTYKIHGVVTNYSREELTPKQVLNWYYERSGYSEKVHSIMKRDFAGGQSPSNKFGANAAWWWIMMFSLNVTSALKELALGAKSRTRRMKGLRFSLFNIPGKVICHCDKLIIKIAKNHPSFQWLLTIRKKIYALTAPSI